MQQEPDAEAFGLLLRLGKELWMSHAIEFIETSLFTRQIKSIATDDELKDLQKELIAWPDKGDLIQQTGGLRKIRMAAGSKGKRGGIRVIYFLATGLPTILSCMFFFSLIAAFPFLVLFNSLPE